MSLHNNKVLSPTKMQYIHMQGPLHDSREQTIVLYFHAHPNLSNSCNFWDNNLSIWFKDFDSKTNVDHFQHSRQLQPIMWQFIPSLDLSGRLRYTFKYECHHNLTKYQFELEVYGLVDSTWDYNHYLNHILATNSFHFVNRDILGCIPIEFLVIH